MTDRSDRLPHYQDAIADSYGPALEGNELEAWLRAQEDLALERERAALHGCPIAPAYGIPALPADAPRWTTEIRSTHKRLTLEDLKRHAREPIAWSPARPYRRAAHQMAEVLADAFALLEQWATIEELARAQGVDYERPAFTHRRRSIQPQGPVTCTRGILMHFGPRPITKAERREADLRELWLEDCKRRLQGALTRHALLGDALATIHQAWQHDGDVVLEHVRDELEAWQ